MTALQQVAAWARLDDHDRSLGVEPADPHRLILEFKARQVDALERIAEALEEDNRLRANSAHFRAQG